MESDLDVGAIGITSMQTRQLYLFSLLGREKGFLTLKKVINYRKEAKGHVRRLEEEIRARYQK